ncbi:tRNA (5-methylaminomethyl-2-thiouridine)(34)-methyltransferase MnmD [Mucilaginibacter sp. UC70_90]
MNHELTIVTTADGSNTIYNADVGEHYHSRHGALQESLHVFVKSGLQYFLERIDTNEVSILEVGFGTGLNFFLTADACNHKQIKLSYIGIEAYPVNVEMMLQTGYQQYIPELLWEQFNSNYTTALTGKVEINNNVQLHVAHSKLLDFKMKEQVDVIYFDAFAAAHQPEMWNEEAIGHTVTFLKPGGVFVTYAITGNLKRMLKSQGFKVEKAPGAPGKREMLRAVKL